jgi:hypothetical protein
VTTSKTIAGLIGPISTWLTARTLPSERFDDSFGSNATSRYYTVISALMPNQTFRSVGFSDLNFILCVRTSGTGPRPTDVNFLATSYQLL